MCPSLRASVWAGPVRSYAGPGQGRGGRASAFCHELLPLVRAHRGRALRPWRRVGAPRVFPWLLPLSPVLARGDRRRGGHLAEWQHRGARRCLDCDVQVPSPLSAFVCLPGASCASTQTCEPRCVSPGRAEGLLALQSVLRSFSEDGIDFCRTGAPSCARWHRAAWPPQCMCPPRLSKCSCCAAAHLLQLPTQETERASKMKMTTWTCPPWPRDCATAAGGLVCGCG